MENDNRDIYGNIPEVGASGSAPEDLSENLSGNFDNRSDFIDENRGETVGSYSDVRDFPLENVYLPTKKKKSGSYNISRAFIAVLCVVCALIGGFSGGLSVFVIQNVEKETTEDSAKVNSDFSETINVDASRTEKEDNTLAGMEETSAAETMTETTAEEPTTITVPKLTARDLYASQVDSVVLINATVKMQSGYWGQTTTAEVSGSGFIISPDGYIVTNHHVITGGTNIKVTLHNGEKCDARLVGSEKSNDVAVLKIEKNDLQHVNWGDSDDLRVGDDIIIIGNPLGELTDTLTNGMVSALSRKIESENDIINMFQTNAAINSGNSGGPVFDMYGKVVGIATSKYVASAIEGLSFFIPVNDVEAIVADIITFGYVKGRPLLGVTVQTITQTMATRYKLVLGAYIVEQDAECPATAAGIQKGDVVTIFKGSTIADAKALQLAVSECKPGEVIAAQIYRGGQYIDVSITLGEKKPAEARTSYSDVYDL